MRVVLNFTKFKIKKKNLEMYLGMDDFLPDEGDELIVKFKGLDEKYLVHGRTFLYKNDGTTSDAKENGVVLYLVAAR